MKDPIAPPGGRSWLNQWWSRASFAVITVALWVLLASQLGTLGAFTRETTVSNVALWAATGTIGFGIFAVATFVRAPDGYPLLPGLTLAILSVACFLVFIVYLASINEGYRLSVVDGMPKDYYWPGLQRWPSVLAIPVTSVIGLLALLERFTKHRTIWRTAIVIVGIVPFPAYWVIFLLQP